MYAEPSIWKPNQDFINHFESYNFVLLDFRPYFGFLWSRIFFLIIFFGSSEKLIITCSCFEQRLCKLQNKTLLRNGEKDKPKYQNHNFNNSTKITNQVKQIKHLSLV